MGERGCARRLRFFPPCAAAIYAPGWEFPKSGVFQVMAGAQTLSGRILAGLLVPELKSGLKCTITSLQSFTANKHTGSAGTRNKIRKNKKGRVISLFFMTGVRTLDLVLTNRCLYH